MTGPREGGRVAPEPDARVSPPRDPVVIDGGDRACVRLLLELRARISGLPADTVIHLIASDPAAPVDLPAWCHLTGHAYLGPVPAARPTYAMRTVPARRHRPGFPLAAPRLTRIPAAPAIPMPRSRLAVTRDVDRRHRRGATWVTTPDSAQAGTSRHPSAASLACSVSSKVLAGRPRISVHRFPCKYFQASLPAAARGRPP